MQLFTYGTQPLPGTGDPALKKTTIWTGAQSDYTTVTNGTRQETWTDDGGRTILELQTDILSLADCRSLLISARDHKDGLLLPYVALGLFAGLNHFAHNKHEGETASWAGNSPNVIHRHYKALVKEADAKEFWEITPDNVGQIIPMPKPAPAAAAVAAAQ